MDRSLSNWVWILSSAHASRCTSHKLSSTVCLRLPLYWVTSALYSCWNGSFELVLINMFNHFSYVLSYSMLGLAPLLRFIVPCRWLYFISLNLNWISFFLQELSFSYSFFLFCFVLSIFFVRYFLALVPGSFISWYKVLFHNISSFKCMQFESKLFLLILSLFSAGHVFIDPTTVIPMQL